MITTPMGELEPELERGITYVQDNEPETIAAAMRRVVASANSNGVRRMQHSRSMVRGRSAKRSTGW